MQVMPAPGNAAVAVFPVVPKIDEEDILRGPELMHPLIHELALLRRDQKLRTGMLPNGHIGEVPAEQAALFDHGVHELLGGHFFGVSRMVTGGKRSEERR